MIEIFCGALGALAVITAFLLGKASEKRSGGGVMNHPAGQEENEEERRLLREEQQAFEDMLHYNMDTAYGLGDREAVLTGGENR